MSGAVGYAMRMPGRARGPDVRGTAPQHAAELVFYLRECARELARLQREEGGRESFCGVLGRVRRTGEFRLG